MNDAYMITNLLRYSIVFPSMTVGNFHTTLTAL